MPQDLSIIQQTEIENHIFTIRGVQVMLDSHLAEMYAVENKRLNEQVKRNIDRFTSVASVSLANLRKQKIEQQVIDFQ